MSRTRDISNIYGSNDFGDGENIISISNNYSASSNDIIFVNTASASINVTFPSSPVLGNKIKILDSSNNASERSITVLGNGNNISGASAYIINTDRSYSEFTYLSSSQGWLVNNLYFPLARPAAPTSVSAVDVGTGRAYNNGAATVSFVVPITGGPVDSYTATSTPGSFTGTGISSPIVVEGLQSNVNYTFTVTSTNNAGSSISSSSTSITATTVPQAPTITTANARFERASIDFSANGTGGKAISSYTVSSSGGVSNQSGSSSPISIPTLTPGTTYTFTMTATNANGTSASSTSLSATPYTATGGSITTSGGYRFHTFTGTANFILSGNSAPVEYVLIGGGGGGGSGIAGAGGAGGKQSGTSTVSAGTYSVGIGGGGGGGSDDNNGGGGGPSTFNGITATGGGAGLGFNGGRSGGSAGSNGGTGSGAVSGGQGGGGGGSGGSASGVTGGTFTTFYGTNYAAGGGAGSNFGGGEGSGGGAGAGNGAPNGTAGSATSNTGSGGGGGGNNRGNGGSGGSGIAILRYLQ
jgi:hypothetical protein